MLRPGTQDSTFVPHVFYFVILSDLLISWNDYRIVIRSFYGTVVDAIRCGVVSDDQPSLFDVPSSVEIF